MYVEYRGKALKAVIFNTKVPFFNVPVKVLIDFKKRKSNIIRQRPTFFPEKHTAVIRI